MRVITGTARGVRLKTPEGMRTRPTTDRVKEALFSILQFEIEGRRVLDLFSGTGQLGIEDLSRTPGGSACPAQVMQPWPQAKRRSMVTIHGCCLSPIGVRFFFIRRIRYQNRGICYPGILRCIERRSGFADRQRSG